MLAETREISDHETASQTSFHDPVVNDAVESSQHAGQPSSHKDKMPMHKEADRLNTSAAGDSSSSKKDLTGGKALSVERKTLGGQLSSLESYGVKDRVKDPVNMEDAECTLGKYLRHIPPDEPMEFDPSRQHRHFCPWIASMNDEEPGWQQTLSASCCHKNCLNPSPNGFPSSTSILKLFANIGGSSLKLFLSSLCTEYQDTSFCLWICQLKSFRFLLCTVYSGG